MGVGGGGGVVEGVSFPTICTEPKDPTRPETQVTVAVIMYLPSRQTQPGRGGEEAVVGKVVVVVGDALGMRGNLRI